MITVSKRSVVSFFIITLLFTAMLFRIAYISETLSAQADSQKSSRLVTVGQTRGMIYDRNMKPLVNREMHRMLIVNPTADAMAVLEDQLQPDEYAKAQENAKTGRPFLFQCDTYNGECEDIADVVVYE